MCLRTALTRTASEKETKKRKGRGESEKREKNAGATRGDDAPRVGTGVGVDTWITIDEITFQQKNATRVIR